MGSLYHFVSLSPAQESRRRQLLDNYGQLAQISALIALFAFQSSFAVRFLIRKWDGQHGRKGKEHQSPRQSTFPKRAATRSGFGSWFARLRWALGEDVVPGWGTRLEWLVGAVWTGWLLVLVVKHTGDDYLHLTKRFGIVAASQLPLHYLLAAKSWSPVQFLTRMSHEELNPYHRLLGRILLTFFSIHALMYLNFYIQKSLLLKRIQDRDVILGLLAITTLLTLGTTALSKIRTYSYRLFFILHVLLSISILPILYFHVSHLRIYIIESVAIYLLLLIQRTMSSTPTVATISHLPSSSLLSISLQPEASAKRTSIPGQHIYLSLPATSNAPLNKLRLNPFTIANLPAKDGHRRLIVRPLSGTTQLLSDFATTRNNRRTTMYIEGPYGASPHFPELMKSYDRILLVAGGVGATFILPIYRNLLLQNVRGDPELESKIRFVWSVRKAADAMWGIKYLQDDGVYSLLHGFQVFVSKSREPITREAAGATAEVSFELEERNQLLEEDEAGRGRSANNENCPNLPRQGRPDLRHIVDDVFSSVEGEKVAVLVCGPAGMGRAMRKEVGRWVSSGREVFWHNEEFGW